MSATSSILSRGLGLVLVEFEYEYEGRDGALVSIKPNERYILVAKTNDHWWQVRTNSSAKPFYIPAKYVKELPMDFPSPLDFVDAPSLDMVPLVPPVPVPVPVPKPLEEPSGNRTKQGDEVTICFRPDTSTRYHKNENRMSTFGVPLDLTDIVPLGVLSSRHSASHLAGPAETVTTATTGSTNTDDIKKQPDLLGLPEDHMDSGKPWVPSFSPADPHSTSRPQTELIPVETPVVPSQDNLHPTSPSSEGYYREDERMSLEERSEKVEAQQKEEDSNHIYESIQDLGLEGLVGGTQSPGELLEKTTVKPAPSNPKDNSSPVYAYVSSLKKAPTPQISVSDLSSPPPAYPALNALDHRLSSSSSSSSMISPASPMSPQDGWQVHTDQESGKVFYYHPVTRQTTWSSPVSPLTGDSDPTPQTSFTSSQGSSCWEQLLDQVSGRVYYYNLHTRVTSWEKPEPPAPSSPAASNRKLDGSLPPLPAEDYPVDGPCDHNNTIFTTNSQQQTPRAQLDLKDPSSRQRQQEQSMMGNGVSEEGVELQVRNWRHSIAEETVTAGLRRVASDLTDTAAGKNSPNSLQLSDRFRLRRNLFNQSTGSHQHCHLLEKAGIINKTKVVDNGKKIRKNWTESWTVLHGGILTFHKDPKFAPAGNAGKASQIIPEYTVDLRGASLDWASKDKSSKKNVLELKTRQGCEYLMQYDTDSIICDWLKVIKDAIHQLEQEHLSEDEDEATSDREDRDRKRTSSRSSSGSSDSEQRQVRSKLRRFLQRRPTLQSIKEKGYIRDNVFGCHLDTLCHRENSNVPKFVEKCIRSVERRGLDVDGIYRVSGNLAVIQRLRHKADHEEQLDLEDGQWEEIHVITGALKLFFRELPEPLFPFSSFDKFIAAIQVPDYMLRVSYMKDLVRSLPLPNYKTMELLFKHLSRVVEHKDSNRMSVQSIAIVFGPTLLRPQTESANMTVHMVFQSQIVELMLNKFQTVFSEL
ncbi:rho GTPase-activating protein 27 [Xenentodon cancila]